MTFTELQKRAIKEYYPALVLEKMWPRRRGTNLTTFFRVAWGVFLVIGAFVYGLSITNPHAGLDFYVPRVFGGFFITFGLWLAAAAIHSFYLSYYFRSMPEAEDTEKPPMSFELSRILFQSSTSDILDGFIASDEGYTILLRCGLTHEEIKDFLVKHRQTLQSVDITFAEDDYVNASEYCEVLYDTYKDFSELLFSHGIQKNDFLAVVDWVIELEIGLRARSRWWSRERLGRIPGLGKNWSYGQIFTLEKYERAIPELEGEEYEVHDVYGSEELRKLESILARNREANALIVGNDNAGNIHIIARLHRMIEQGKIMPQLEHKRLIMLDADVITASAHTKTDFEALLMGILNEAYNAGNVILVFADFPAFISSSETLGADLASILDSYLASSELQIIALSNIDRFHAQIERNTMLMERFEQIIVEDIDESNTIRVLENEIIPLEYRNKVFFTYPALEAIADSALRYFPDGIMPDKAIDLLFEVAPKLAARGQKVVGKEDILQLVKTKTGIPVGKVTDEEREKLLHLEEILHHRIIGQDEAVLAISNAVRRARSGINNPNRPLASFLFLGPTGVGKTETTKALAEVFFGKDVQILRLDMSEYSETDALSKLIGSHKEGKEGVLTSMLKEHPYGVLLLDEFEKTTPEVMNLFLQILDEGFFSDMMGKKVNTRNLLIIATSNAGSDLMWEALKQGEDPGLFKDLIVDSIIKNHIMKPELINRFDGVIVFHPLAKNQLEKIARLQLEKLSARLAERGVKVVVTDDLVKFLMQYGMDPKFGARPMNRAIQDTIEQVIAEKLIRGDIQAGSEVALTEADLKK